MNQFSIGDINDHLKSGNEKHIDTAQYFNGLKKGQLEEIDRGTDSEVELAFNITSRLRIYLSSGYLFTKGESSSGFEISPPEFFNVDFTFSPRISVRAIPIKLGISYTVPLAKNAKIYLNGGRGYYSIKANYYWEQIEIWTEDDGSLFTDIRQIVEWDLSSKGSGYHWGIGLEYNLSKNLSLTIEYQRRSVLSNKLEGTEVFLGWGYDDSFYGSVYYFEKMSPVTEKYYIGVGFYKSMPGEPYQPFPEYKNIRYAKLDLSGDSLKIGLRIRLF
ncbi:MAG: outer membrane beta-barrel protein [Candidatus Hermodarchaeota archaeon]